MMIGLDLVKIEDGDINLDAMKHGLLVSKICASKFFITYNEKALAMWWHFSTEAKLKN